MAKINPPAVVPREGTETVGAVIIESAIVEIAKGMRAIGNSRLKTETIVTLIHDHTKVSKRDIRIVFDALWELENLFLKPRKDK